MQHLVDLLPHRLVTFEEEGGERTALQTPPVLQLGHGLTAFAPRRGVFGGGEDIGAGQRALGYCLRIHGQAPDTAIPYARAISSIGCCDWTGTCPSLACNSIP